MIIIIIIIMIVVIIVIVVTILLVIVVIIIIVIIISLMETGWSPQGGRPYYSMAIIRLLSDIKHLISTE